MFYEFKDIGEIVDVIIPHKKDRRGRRYGFVQYTNVTDEKLLTTKLDNIIFEGRKLFANILDFKEM